MSCCFPAAEWSENDVVEKYLKPTGFEHMAEIFVKQHINGAVLLALEVNHCACVCYGAVLLALEVNHCACVLTQIHKS